MVEKIIEEMLSLVEELQGSISLDMDDIQNAKHEDLLLRNDKKHELINKIVELKTSLNEALVNEMQNGVDVNIYRQKVDFLEGKLKELYEANRKLASLVLPIQQMYKDLVEEITEANGGQIFDLKA